jgi:hypothetical protein
VSAVIRNPKADIGWQDWPHTEFVTRYAPPSIPVRFFDWTAVEEGYEPGRPIGHGATEEDAITHLLDQLEDRL